MIYKSVIKYTNEPRNTKGALSIMMIKMFVVLFSLCTLFKDWFVKFWVA